MTARPRDPGQQVLRSATIVAVLAAVVLLAISDMVLVPLLLAALLSTCLGPVVTRLCRLGLPRPVASAIVVLVLMSAVGGLMSLLKTPISELLANLPAMVSQVRHFFHARAAGDGESMLAAASWIAADIRDAVIVAGLAIAFTYFMLAWGGGVGRAVISALRRRGARGVTLRVCAAVRTEVTLYLATISVINVAFGVLTALLLALLGVEHPLELGVLAALLNFIPVAGALTMLALLGAMAVQAHGLQVAALPVPGAFAALHLLESQFVTPHMLGRRLVLNPLIVVVGILLGGALWGLGGAFLAVPVLTTLKVTADVLPHWRRWGQVLGRGPSRSSRSSQLSPNAGPAPAPAARKTPRAKKFMFE